MSADTHTLTHQEPHPEDDNESIATPEKLTGNETDEQIAKRLSAIIDSSLARIEPLLNLLKEVCSVVEIGTRVAVANVPPGSR